jgi:hypothetical protein
MIGSSREKPILRLARNNVNAASHLYGFRYVNKILILRKITSGRQERFYSDFLYKFGKYAKSPAGSR